MKVSPTFRIFLIFFVSGLITPAHAGPFWFHCLRNRFAEDLNLVQKSEPDSTALNALTFRRGFVPEAEALDISAKHTMVHLDTYVEERLGKEIMVEAKKGNSNIMIILGDRRVGLNALEEAGWKIIRVIKKKKADVIPIYLLKQGNKIKYVITNVNGKDREIYVDSILKQAGLPESRLETIGDHQSLRDVYLGLFRSLGYHPDAVFYGFRNTILSEMFKRDAGAAIIEGPKSLIQTQLIEKWDLEHANYSEVHGLPMAEVTLKNGKKVWLFQNLYGDQVNDLFNALGDFGTENISYLGTAGSLNENFKVGTLTTPAAEVDEKGQLSKLPQLKPFSSVAVHGNYSHVSAPALETTDWASQHIQHGTDFVDVELKYFLEFSKKHPEIKSRVSLVISDQMQGEGAQDLTSWGSRERTSTGDSIFPLIQEILGSDGYTGLKKIHFHSIDQLPAGRESILAQLQDFIEGGAFHFIDSMNTNRRIVPAARSKYVKMVPLNNLIQNHPIWTTNAVQNVIKRATILTRHTSEILDKGALTENMSQRFMASNTPIDVVMDREGNYAVINGNGRVAALKRAFPQLPDLPIEVQVYQIDDPKVLDLIDQFRRRNLPKK